MDREQIILDNLGNVWAYVNYFVDKHPSLKGVQEDLYSEGYVRLVEVVDRFLEENREIGKHFANYLRISIVAAMVDYVREDYTIRTPRTSKRASCVGIKGDLIEQVDDEDGITWHEANAILFNCLRDEKDVLIVMARIDGARTDAEVAKWTGYSRSNVRTRLKRIKQTYKTLRNHVRDNPN